MKIVRIDDPDDPRLAAYRDIRERDLRGREGLFIAEGKVVLNVLFAARRFAADSVLILENRLEGMSETLALAPQQLPVYVAAAPVLDRIAGFHLHRGILAAGRRPQQPDLEEVLDALPAEALVLVLVGIANHDNMGALFRNAAAFGVDLVLLDSTSCDPLYRKAIRVSVGAALKVPFAVAGSAAEIAASLAARGFSNLALSPRGGEDIRTVRAGPRVALFMGTEGEGLPAAVMAAMRTARIRMAEGFDSLNVAAAAAIALHQLAALPR
ncbi:MAG: RNA methyltransferase [Rhizobiales bacterium]|nr:RNA methyltransferase [Hyphomicrobiales bacterium]